MNIFRGFLLGINAWKAVITNFPRDRQVDDSYDATNLADATTFRMELDMDNWYYAILELEGVNVTYTIEGTLDKDASSGKDISTQILGAASYAIGGTADGDIFMVDTPMMFKKLFIVYTTTNASNVVSIKARRF